MKSAWEEVPQLILPGQRSFFMKQQQAVRSQEMPHIHIAGCLPFFRRRRRGLNSSGSESTPPSNSQVDPFFLDITMFWSWPDSISRTPTPCLTDSHQGRWAPKRGPPASESRNNPPNHATRQPTTTIATNPPQARLYLSEFETNMVQHSPKEAMDWTLNSSEASWRLLSVAPCTLLTSVRA